ncbi:hypothetical protein [Paenibacillus koleovorans]|uniref:hypothetical protein n=1 Tax=Paenibacillus koleovorans TaxID=121608 RepID=UPI000FDA7E50|nr:hypothetical protein [Paenibacillus koleovorans]
MNKVGTSMYKIVRKVLLITIFGWGLGLSCLSTFDHVLALNCAAPGKPREELAKYDVVFSGVVRMVETKNVRFPNAIEPKKVVIFDVHSIWQGLQQNRIKVVGTPDHLQFERGKPYLVYAYTQQEDKHIWSKGDIVVSACTRTVELAKADYDLQQLGQGYPPTERTDVKDRVWMIVLGVFAAAVCAALGALQYWQKTR